MIQNDSFYQFAQHHQEWRTSASNHRQEHGTWWWWPLDYNISNYQAIHSAEIIPPSILWLCSQADSQVALRRRVIIRVNWAPWLVNCWLVNLNHVTQTQTSVYFLMQCTNPGDAFGKYLYDITLLPRFHLNIYCTHSTGNSLTFPNILTDDVNL